jgi:hypothetical protein
VLAAGAAAVMFVHSAPAGGSDLAVEAAGVLAGAAMGAIGGLATRLRLGADGEPPHEVGRDRPLSGWATRPDALAFRVRRPGQRVARPRDPTGGLWGPAVV